MDANDETLLWDLARRKAVGKGPWPPAPFPLYLYGSDTSRMKPAEQRALKGKPLPRLEGIFSLLTSYRARESGDSCVEGCPVDPVLVSSDLGLAAYIHRWSLMVARLKGRRSRRRLPRKKATKLVSFVGQGRWLAVATRKHAVVLHDLTAKAHFGPFAGHKTAVDSIAVSPDGKLLATGDDGGQVIVWEIAGARRVQTLKPTGGGVTALAFGPDRLLAAAAADRSMTVWRFATP